ncbi:MAG: hypothetical protein GXP05_12915 [Alphaproteobacteria bacterium]|nr:hypothetical protein [Alphaproteobacteria bacterium]
MAVARISHFSLIISLIWLGLTSTASAYSGEQFVTCNLNPNGDNFLALRSCGSSKCDTIRKLGPDTFLLTMEPSSENNWREVILLDGLQDESYAGVSGWVYDKYICRIDYRWKD